MNPGAIPFLDLAPRADAAAVREAIDRVLTRGWFVLGPELEAFEHEFAAASGAPHAVGVASGTDAIALLLRASGLEPGGEVLVPALTAAFTGLAVLAAGGVPRIVDVDPHTLTLDPEACAAAVTARTRAIVPVHLYGQPADMDAIVRIADRHALLVVEDCCQAHLATAAGTPVGTTTAGGAFSFYPTKNLGALGDAGAIVTRHAGTADRIRRLRNGGQAARDNHVEPGVNSRLDELQAAVLRTRLPGLPAATARRRALAARYRHSLPAPVEPVAERDPGHVYHLFPVRTPRRDALATWLAAAGIGTLVHYPRSLSSQQAFAPWAPAATPVADRAAAELVSLPLHPSLADDDVDRVAEVVRAWDDAGPRAYT